MTVSAPEAITPLYLLAMISLLLLVITGVVRWSPARLVAAAVFITYAAMVAAVTIFPIRIDTEWGQYDHLIDRYVLLQPLTDIGHPQFILNILMFVPFGLLLPVVMPRMASLPRIALAGIAASLAIEGSQLAMLIVFGNRRWVEVDDLIANTAGAVIGYVLFVMLASASRSPDEQRLQGPVLR